MAEGSVGRRTRGLIGPVLSGNLAIFLIILGLSGWSLDKYINGEQNHQHLGGNPSTSFMLIFELITGVSGASSVIPGLIHLRAWRSDSLASATSSVSFPGLLMLLLLVRLIGRFTIKPFSTSSKISFNGLVCKEIILGGHRGKRLQTLEALIIISLVSQFLYLGLLHAGTFSSRYGPNYCSSGSGNAPQKTENLAVI